MVENYNTDVCPAMGQYRLEFKKKKQAMTSHKLYLLTTVINTKLF